MTKPDNRLTVPPSDMSNSRCLLDVEPPSYYEYLFREAGEQEALHNAFQQAAHDAYCIDRRIMGFIFYERANAAELEARTATGTLFQPPYKLD